MNKLVRFTSYVLLGVIVMLWSLYTFPKLKVLIEYIRFEDKICRKPITYAVSGVDKRFDISQQEIADAFDKAELVWELEASKELFQRVNANEKHDVEVVFAYDSRQETTAKVSEIERDIDAKASVLEGEKQNFTEREQKYLEVLSQHNKLVAEYNAYSTRKSELSTTENSYAIELRKRIDTLSEKLAQQEKEIKSQAENINQHVSGINVDIESYNNLQNKNGESFREAEYVSVGNSRTIFIYEFPSKSVLSRLLSHELGHAIGLEHVDGDDSIMNEYNMSRRLTPTVQDVSELNRACSRQSTLKTLISKKLNNN